MIYILNVIYKDLISLSTSEDCGFVGGNLNTFLKVYPAQNKSKLHNQFHVGILEKAHIAWEMSIDGNNKIHALYHVHDNSNKMSSQDIRYSDLNDINIIICKGNLKMYIIEGKEKHKQIKELEYKIKE